MINTKVRLEVSQVVSQIENLAVRVRTALDSGVEIKGEEIMGAANALVSQALTFTFSVG